MFTPPVEPAVIRGSAAGILTAYWWGVGAAVVITALLAVRSSYLAAAGVAALALAVFAAMSYFATGTRVEVSRSELVVAKRWRPAWRIPMSEYRYVVENVPVRPRASALAGWTFHTRTLGTQKMEIAMFARDDRRRLRQLFDDTVLDADAGMPRRWR